MHESYPGEKGGFYAEFRLIARWLQRLADRPGTTPLLDSVRHFIEATYPVGPGEDVLGRPCARRCIHSVSTAATDHGVHTPRMQCLIRAVASAPGHSDLPPPGRHLWINAASWHPWLARYARALNPKQAAARLGVQHDMFKRLVSVGWIQLVVSLRGLVDRYDPDDLAGFLNSLFASAQPLTRIDPDMAPIMAAYPRCRRDAIALMALIRGGRLGFVGRRLDVEGIPALAIRPEEVLDLCAGPRLDGWRHYDLKRLLGLNSSAA